MSETWCLSLHANWRCRHYGACCKAGWAIPIEGPQFESISAARRPESDSEPLFVTRGPLPAGAAAILARRPGGSCVFLDGDSKGLCEIHRTFGPHVLPIACRQFPRIVLQDRRGTLVTLSHFCPTAAALLFDAPEPEVMRAPPEMARDAIEGLDATHVMPPLLRPGLLTDSAGYGAWERRAIRTLSRADLTAWSAVETIGAATSVVEAWSPSEGPLTEAVHRAFDRAAGVEDGVPDFRDALNRARLAAASVPAGLAVPAISDDVAEGWPEVRELLSRQNRAVRAYLAARLFGNWMVYSVPGLRTVVEYLRVVLAVTAIETARHRSLTEAFRQADLLLVHLSDYRALGRLIASRASKR